MKLIITSKGGASKIINSSLKITHIISIGTKDPLQRPPRGFEKHPAQKLRLEFWDISTEKRKKMNGPSQKDVDKILSFCEEIINSKEPSVLIHCFAGVSRSTAAGLILLNKYFNNIKKAREELFKLVPHASPNTRMLKLANIKE
jgi:predicted protein tyrosine phosphatase